MKLRIIVIATYCCLLSFCSNSQSICDPLTVIGETSRGLVWEAVFYKCFDPSEVLVRAIDDPRNKASIIKAWRIRKITTMDHKEHVIASSYFDTSGYLRFKGYDGDSVHGFLEKYERNKTGLPIVVRSVDNFPRDEKADRGINYRAPFLSKEMDNSSNNGHVVDSLSRRRSGLMGCLISCRSILCSDRRCTIHIPHI